MTMWEDFLSLAKPLITTQMKKKRQLQQKPLKNSKTSEYFALHDLRSIVLIDMLDFLQVIPIIRV